MNTETGCQDVMQVCRNGHVITDLLHTYPERGAGHCEQCGAETLDRCPTCGHELPGAVHVPGLVPVGRSEPPQFCAHCGASFPWSPRPAPSAGPWPVLENLLRRLPRAIRQLRVRQGDRPAFRVHDERDLEDLLRAVLPLSFEGVRPECRTASYALGTSTDFLLDAEAVAVTVKRARPDIGEQELSQQLQEDADYYGATPKVKLLVCFVYDPEGVLAEPRQLEARWSRPQAALDVRVVIAT
jgi:hypothetical protein